MILYVNGDSNSAGAELDNLQHAWPNILASRLNVDLINQAKGGSSNDKILRTTVEFLDNLTHSDLFVIIGWTSWEREEWQYQDQYYDVNAGGHDTLPPVLQEQYKHWVVDQGPTAQSKKSMLMHDKIYQLHQQLNNQHIKHVFFNALMPFQHNVLSNTQDRHSWNNNYIGPYDNDWSYYWHLKNRGFAPTAGNHYLEPGNLFWADTLEQYIKTNLS